MPLSPTFFSILVAIFLALVVLIQLGVLHYAFARIGIGAGPALLLLLGSLIGSYVNIPVAQLPARQIMSGRDIIYFGMHYVVPVVVDWPGTVIAVNIGGALLPGLMSIYLLIKNRLWVRVFSPPPALPRCAMVWRIPYRGLELRCPYSFRL